MDTKGKHIVIISQSHLCRNPRVYKEAITLANAGYDITIITSIYADKLLQEDQELLKGSTILYKFAADLRSKSYKNHYVRFVRALSMKLVKWLGIQLPASLGYNLRGYYSLLNKSGADLYIAHQELPSYLGCLLIKKGKKVAFDFEDWYSEDLLNEAKSKRPLKLLKKAEAYALKNGAYVQTTSHVLADALARCYKVKKPIVIYNTFNTSGISSARHDRKNLNVPSLYWFSQTIGPGRGIETIIEALKKVKQPLELHLRGQCSIAYNAFLFQLLGVGTPHKLYIHSLLPNNELSASIKEHDIGLAFEHYQPLNRYLTVTNKIFHYLVNEIPVIASPTSGQCEVEALATGCVFITKDFSSNALADTINLLFTKPERLIQAKQLLNKLSTKINWDTEQNKLLKTVTDILEK